ncbi:MAG: hypothetical protein V7677_18365, partial [Motiliproteus sp.]
KGVSEEMKHGEFGRKQKNKERYALLIIVALIVPMGCFAFFYTYDFGSPTTVKITSKESISKVSQRCEQKLYQYIEQGNTDLEGALKYGELQGCNFSGEAKKTEAEKLPRSWQMN